MTTYELHTYRRGAGIRQVSRPMSLEAAEACALSSWREYAAGKSDLIDIVVVRGTWPLKSAARFAASEPQS